MCILGTYGQILFRIYFLITFNMNSKKGFSGLSLIYNIIITILGLFPGTPRFISAFCLCFTTFWTYSLYYSLVSSIDDWFDSDSLVRKIIDWIFSLTGIFNLNKQTPRDNNDELYYPYDTTILEQLKYIPNFSYDYKKSDICEYDDIDGRGSELKCDDEDKLILISKDQYNWLQKTYNNSDFWYEDYLENDVSDNKDTNVTSGHTNSGWCYISPVLWFTDKCKF